MSEEIPKATPLIFSTELSSSTKFKGSLTFSEPLCIKGKFSGSVHGNSFLFLDRSAEVVSTDVKVESLLIAGGFSGSAEASSSIELLPKAVVQASLNARTLKIDERARYEGRLAMQGLPENWKPWDDEP